MVTPTTPVPQRELILDTAAEAFADFGFPSASMAEIARRCGVSKALLYHYYESKEAILFDLLDRYTRSLVVACDEIRRHPGDARERLADLIRVFLGEYRTSQARHRILVHDVQFLAAEQHQAVIGQMRRVVSEFRDAIAAAYPGEIPEESLSAATMLLFGMINWTFTWMKPDGRLSYPDLAEMVIRFCAHGMPGLGAAEPAEAPRVRARQSS